MEARKLRKRARRWLAATTSECFCFARPSGQGISGASARLKSTDQGTCGKDIRFSHNREDIDSGNLGNFTVTIGRHFGCCAQYGARPAFPSSYQAIPRASRVAGGRGRVLFCSPSTTPRLLRCFEKHLELYRNQTREQRKGKHENQETVSEV